MVYVPGPYDSNHLYLQWGGKLPGNEQWSCGMRLYGPSATAVADAASLIDDMVTPIKAFHQSNSTYICAPAKLSFIKLNAIGTDGHYMAPTTNVLVQADIAGGGPATPIHPNQVALAISLETGFSRGPAHAGRFYMPLPGFTVGADGLIAAADRDLVKGTANGLITAINATNGTWKVGVFSRKSPGAGHRAVTSAAVGRVYDTQRRRRRSLAELY
jgi:hypothetical protein